MADKPSRGLVLYGDRLARFIDPSHTHLHSLASTASCGFLSLPTSPPSETEDDRIVREFALLLDACDTCLHISGKQTAEAEGRGSLMPNLSERFMGVRAALITNNSSLRSFGGKLGLTVLQINELFVEIVASEVLKLLGFEQGKTLDVSEYDLVFVHIGAGEKVNDEKDIAFANDMKYINTLVGAIMGIAQPGSEIGSRLHLSLVMSYGYVSESDDPKFSVLTSGAEKNSDLETLFPRQSYTMRGETPRNNVRHYCPMLIAQWQFAVTRKDMAHTFSFEDFKQHGGNLVIPADRFLYEVAFKLWKAPKYGA